MPKAFNIATTILLTAVCGAVLSVITSAQSSLQGTWRVAEITTPGASSPNSNPQPGLFIFTAKHYSLMDTEATGPRPPFPSDVSKATAAEFNAAWQSINAQSGTYEYVAPTLTTHPFVAKNPNTMKPGSIQRWRVRIDGNTLWLTQTLGVGGPMADAPTFKLVRVE